MVFCRISRPQLAPVWATVVLVLAMFGRAVAQPTIVSVVPTNTATGVSPTAPVVITFSAPMDTNLTTATFYTSITTPPYVYYYTNTVSWNATSNVLTSAPAPAFMSSAFVVWSVSGRSLGGTALSGTKSGHFTTGSTNLSGTGTNAVTTFVVGRVSLYGQASTAQPTPNSVEPFVFLASTTLASNRNANSITVTLPNAAVSNLLQNPTAPENWNFGIFNTNSAVLDTNFPPGTYTFNVNANASNETFGVSFPASLVQPPAPHLANFVAAQSVNPAQPFTLQWDAFSGGARTDYIVATVATVWQSPNPGTANALNGTATSVTIPAGTLAPGTTYTASIGFSHALLATNGTDATYVYRATDTQFSLTTTTGSTTPPVMTNFVWSAGTFGFDVLTSAGQTVTVVTSTNPATPLASWSVLQTFTNPGTSIHISDPRSITNPATFYRLRNGN
jgi:hypothetical protein